MGLLTSLTGGASDAQVAAAIAAGVALQDYLETMPGRGSSLSATALTSGTIYIGRVYPDHNFTLTKLMWFNGSVVAGNMEAGVLTYDGSTWTRTGTTGVIAQAGANAKQTATGLSIPVVRSQITYLYLIPGDSTAQYVRNASFAASINDVSSSGIHTGTKVSVGTPCPATITGITANAVAVWIAGTA